MEVEYPMKSVSSNEKKEILLQERSISIGENEMGRFSDYIKEKRKLEASPSGKKYITTRELAERLGIDYELFRKILNKNKPTKKRDCIIAICAALRLNSDETNEALVLYQYMPILDTSNPRDDLLIDILEEQLFNRLTIDKINQRLIRNGFPELDIIDHRTSVKPASEQDGAPFKLLKKQVQTFADDLFFGDQYDSLDTEYNINRYRCVAEMWLGDREQRRVYHLSADAHNGYFIEEHGAAGLEIKSCKSSDDSGIFKDYFLELEAMANHELKKMLCILNDTKNYQTRISAGIGDDVFHVYAETYNYTVPELNEYYLFEYKNGSPLFSVFKNSEFMHCHLGTDEYTRIYGKRQNSLTAQYNSIEQLLSDHDQVNTDLLRCRSHYFKKLQNQADALISDIKAGKKHIRHLDYIYDDRDRVCTFFDVEEEFECVLDGEYGDMMYAGKRSADFRFDDCGVVSITIEDLYKAFELGFNNIREICRVKKKLGSIEAIII